VLTAMPPAAWPRVAVVGPLTGPRASWGQLLTDAVEALPHAPVSWVFFDEQGDAEQARSRALEIVADAGFAAVIGHFNSTGARSAIPLYRAAGLPVLLPLSTAPGLSATEPGTGESGTAGEPGLAIQFCPDDDAQAVTMVQACAARGQQRLAVAHDGSPYGERLAERVLAAGSGHDPQRLLVDPARWPEQAGTAVALLGVHHAVAGLIGDHATGDRLVLVPDDCDIPEFADLTANSAPDRILVARLTGGPFTLVMTAFTALAGALGKHPQLRGRPLLEVIRGEADQGAVNARSAPGAGWELAPPPRRRPHSSGTRFEVVVVGGGVVGRAAAADLAERGVRVGLLDAGTGTSASSVSGGLVRAFEPGAVPRRLAIRSTEMLWGRTQLARQNGFRSTGSLVLFGPEDQAGAMAGVAELRAAGLGAVLLSTSEVRGRWPEIDTSGLDGAVWEPDAGYALATVTLAALRDRGQRAGVTGLSGTARELTDGGVRLAGGQEISADVVVVAAGCGAPVLLGDHWPPGRPARTRRINYTIMDAGGHRLPTVIDLTTGLWLRPDGTDGILAGVPVDDWDVPVAAGRDLEPSTLQRIRTGAGQRFPFLAAAPVLTSRFGTDLYLPGGPVLGPLGDRRTVVAAGWSGGGFKTAPAAGERVAEAALDLLGDRTHPPIRSVR
jgi:glycine/D-amino acid oxidase-like deaminating enzyme